jgi:hypothetical protein
MNRKLQFLMLVATLVATVVSFISTNKVAAVTQSTISFNRDIRPILADTCFLCHGPDKSSRKAALRLDLRDEATKKTRSGITPIVPGKPDESEIVRRIFSTEPAEVMPPKDAHKDLTPQQKELLKRWVAEGAVYEGHWAYQPLTRPAVPTIQNPKSKTPLMPSFKRAWSKPGCSPRPKQIVARSFVVSRWI